MSGDYRPQAPAARVDTKEQRRPAASRHPVHPRPRGPDGGGAGHWPHLRGGPAATAVWLPSRAGRQDGCPTGLLARDAAWAAGGGGRGLARLLHLDPARAADAVPDPAHRRWDAAVTSSRAGSTAPVVEVIDGRPGADHRSAKDEAGNPAGRSRSRPCWRISTSGASCWPGTTIGHRDQLDAHVVNYADDFVICCRPGNAEAAMATMAALMTRLGLEVNETKTRIARLPEETLRLPRLYASVASTARTGAPTSAPGRPGRR